MDFQTHPEICNYMASLLPNEGVNAILEPTQGLGNLARALSSRGSVTAPNDFFKMKPRTFDWIVMNPPFSPMAKGYDIFFQCMEMSDNIIALMPWLTIINSQNRTKKIMDFGLVSITHLPRKAFPGCRVQTCILFMQRGYQKSTEFLNYEFPAQNKM